MRRKIAIYIRLSLEDGDLNNGSKTESNSIGNQRMLLTSYLNSKSEFADAEIIEFCDDGYTGTNFDRPAFQQMMSMVKREQINCIIVKDLSRFGREFLDVSAYLELILPVFGTRFISVNDFFDSNDYVGTTGGIELALKNLINAMYSKDISVKAKSARKTRQRRGEYIGGHPFYGYVKDPKDKHHLIVDENVRPVIEKIFDLCMNGVSTMAIAKILNEAGIPCPAEYKRQNGVSYNKLIKEKKALWIQCTVRKIIKDERYTGKMVSNVRSSAYVGKNIFINNSPDEWIIVHGTHEAIISEEKFENANTALSSRVRSVNKNTNWKNSGNLFACGCCGRKLQKSNSKETYLYCAKARYSDGAECENIQADLEKLQDAVLLTIKTMGRALTEGAVIVKRKNQADLTAIENEIAILQQRQMKIKSEKSQMYENYRTGIITREQFIEMQTGRNEEAAKLEEEISRKELYLDQKRNEQRALKMAHSEMRTVEALKEYDPEIIGQIVEKILVYEGGRIELVMKNKDAYECLLADKQAMSA